MNAPPLAEPSTLAEVQALRHAQQLIRAYSDGDFAAHEATLQELLDLDGDAMVEAHFALNTALVRFASVLALAGRVPRDQLLEMTYACLCESSLEHEPA